MGVVVVFLVFFGVVFLKYFDLVCIHIVNRPCAFFVYVSKVSLVRNKILSNVLSTVESYRRTSKHCGESLIHAA